MGILNHSAKFIFWSLNHTSVSFKKTLTLGRQECYVDAGLLESLLRHAKIEPKQEILTSKYAEPLFSALGGVSIESMDFSPYEGATVIHDLNVTIPDELRKRYSVVFDGGTLEHIFNFPTAIKNCMDMLEVGGYFISVTPANNQLGHGFYQFSPELFFSLFSERNGFKVEAVLIGAEGKGNEVQDFFEVKDPATAGSRVTLANVSPTHLFILARKLQDTNSALAVFQSDYVSTWKTEIQPSPLKKVYKSIIPRKVLDFLWRIFKSEESQKKIHPLLGNVNPQHFKKIDLIKN